MLIIAPDSIIMGILGRHNMQDFFICHFLNRFKKYVDSGDFIMEEADTRVRYTKMVFQQALLKILSKKHIDKITVKELCETAKVNRGTFYLHYTTPNDILMEIEQQFIQENMSLFSPYFDGSYETNYLAGIFSGILNNRDLCKVIMGKNGNPLFLERIQNMLREHVIDGWAKEFPYYSKQDLDYVFDYIFAGSMRLILNWIDNDNGISAAELAMRLDRLGHYSHLSIADFHKKYK